MRHKTRLHTHAIRQSRVARWRHATACILGLALAACSPASDTAASDLPAKSAPADTVSVMVDSVSYRHDRSVSYTLYDMSTSPSTAVGGSIVDRLASGGDKGCCVTLPTNWKPGLKVQVRWEEGDRERMYPEIHKRTLDIPRYEQPSDLYVVFYPSREVEVVVSVGEPGHPSWAGRIKQTPWQFCVAQHGEKVCKAVLPKIVGISDLRGFCREGREQAWPDAELNCETMLDACVKDYDDKEYCHELLWEESTK